MVFLNLYGKEIFSVFIVLLTWMLNNRFRGKAKLSYGIRHGFTFLVPEALYDANGQQIRDSQLVHTRSVIIVNEGRESATKVTIVFNYKPMYLNVWPVHKYETSFTEMDNRYVVTFDNIPPNDSLACELLSINNQLPEILTIKSNECRAQQVAIVNQKATNNILKRCCMLLLFLGIGTFTYLFIVTLQWLLLKTG